MLFGLGFALIIWLLHYSNILLFALKDLYLNLVYTNNPTPQAYNSLFIIRSYYSGLLMEKDIYF